MPFISLELDVRVAFASFRTKSYHSDTEQPFKETKLKFLQGGNRSQHFYSAFGRDVGIFTYPQTGFRR